MTRLVVVDLDRIPQWLSRALLAHWGDEQMNAAVLSGLQSRPLDVEVER